MKKLHTLTAAAGILLALAGPTLAAQRSHRSDDSYARSTDRSGPYNYGPVGGQAYGAQDSGALTPAQHFRSPYNGGPGLPYPDRPYGDPDRD